ncbi:hypothetical protein ACVWW1_003443 [Bradyrhizobium sp. JR3.5]
MEKLDIVASREAVEPTKSTGPSFAHSVMVLCLVGVVGLAVWKLSDVLVLAFGAALLALLLRGLAHELSRRTRIPEAWAVLPVVLTLLGSIVAVGWLFGSQIASQFNLLAKDLPQSLTQLAREFASSSWGTWLLGHAQDINLGNVTAPVASYVAALFGSVVRTVRLHRRSAVRSIVFRSAAHSICSGSVAVGTIARAGRRRGNAPARWSHSQALDHWPIDHNGGCGHADCNRLGVARRHCTHSIGFDFGHVCFRSLCWSDPSLSVRDPYGFDAGARAGGLCRCPLCRHPFRGG